MTLYTPRITVRRENGNYSRRAYWRWGSGVLDFISALLLLAMLAHAVRSLG